MAPRLLSMSDFIGRIASATDGTLAVGLNKFPVPKGSTGCRIIAFGGNTVRFGSGEFVPTASAGAQLVAGHPTNVAIRNSGNDVVWLFATEASAFNLVFHSL